MDLVTAAQILSGVRRATRYVSPNLSLTRVLAGIRSGTTIFVAAGTYEESVTIPATVHDVVIVGTGGRGAVAVEAPANSPALTNHADDVTLVNIGLAGGGTGGGLLNTGRRFRAVGCKIEGGVDAAILSLGTVVQIAAGSAGKGDDVLLEDCELCWADNGLVLRCSDYGAVTQARLRGCTFHNLDTSHLSERVGSGGSAAVGWRNLVVEDSVFEPAEDGTLPTKFLDLDDSNDNTGLVTGCAFPTAINGGLNLVSTKCLWVANRHTGGISAAQPS